MFLYLVRHGISIANEEGIILSDPENGLYSYGLSEKGRIELPESFSQISIPKTALLYSSDFLRTRETAGVLKSHYNISNDIILDVRLRERFFGLLEKKSNHLYEDVWIRDRKDPEHSTFEVEALSDLKKRLLDFLDFIKLKHRDNDSVVVVSHGDPLHVLYTIINKVRLEYHSMIDHWKPGEIRKFSI